MEGWRKIDELVNVFGYKTIVEELVQWLPADTAGVFADDFAKLRDYTFSDETGDEVD